MTTQAATPEVWIDYEFGECFWAWGHHDKATMMAGAKAHIQETEGRWEDYSYEEDLEHSPAGGHVRGNLVRLGCDLANSKEVLEWLAKLGLTECVFAGFFPPCTHIASSGARWWKQKGLRALQESISYFATSQELAEHFGCPYFIENPVSAIATHWRKPEGLPAPDERIWRAPQSKQRAKLRSMTPEGFARAVFLANAS